MQTYTLVEVQKHRKRTDCWVIIDGHVLDVTKFLSQHPAGMDIILEHAGTDATDLFEKTCHSNTAYELMLQYKIGTLATETLITQLYGQALRGR